MNIEELRDYCLLKPWVSESFPFDQTTLVFKAGGKMFLLTDLVDDLAMNVKNTLEKVISLIEQYPSISPGYHMNKKHWVTVRIDGSLTDSFLRDLIDESYQLVLNSLTRKERLAAGMPG